MKKGLLLILMAIAGLTGQAQWSTNGTAIYSTNTGYVGIGTSTPESQLDIVTQYAADGLTIRYSGNTGFLRLSGNNFAATYMNPLTMTGDAGLIYGEATADAVTTGLVIAPFRSSSSGIRLDRYGNVGINTNNTQNYQLAVNGSAIFTSAFVKPYNNWPDYVFNKDYKVPSLSAVSVYLQQNHHLPDIPPADSIQTKGIDLGGTQAALLKKIEELTLYAIDQDKSINELKDIQRQLQKQNEFLAQQLNALGRKLSALTTTTRP